MKTFLISCALAVTALSGVTQAHANPSVSLLYENNEALDQEGVKAELSHQHKKLETSLNVFGDSHRVHSYGASVGVPYKVSKVTVTPFLGVDRYRTVDQTVASIGFGAKYEVLKSIYLDGRVKYVEGLTGSNDKVEDVVYNIGLTKKF